MEKEGFHPMSSRQTMSLSAAIGAAARMTRMTTTPSTTRGRALESVAIPR